MHSFYLQDVAYLQAGYHSKTGIEESPEAPYRLIQGKNFGKFHSLQENSLVAFFPERKPELYLVRKEDVLLQTRGTAHFAVYIEKDLKNVLAGGVFYILRVKNENLLPRYLAWWLNQPKAQAYFQSQARGTRISFISKNTLSRLQISIPPFSVQKKVVKMVTLANHEQFLLNRLSELRSRLVKAACMKAIVNDE